MLDSPPVKDDIFGKYANGTLDLCLAESLENTDGRALSVSIDDSYFYAIYSDALKNNWNESDFVDDYYKFQRCRKEFLRIHPNCELLGKDYDNYADHILNLEQVKRMRSECLTLLPIISNSKADLGLRRLIYSCDEAIKDSLSLLFSCD